MEKNEAIREWSFEMALQVASLVGSENLTYVEEKPGEIKQDHTTSSAILELARAIEKYINEG